MAREVSHKYRVRLRLADGTEKTYGMYTPLSKHGALEHFKRMQGMPAYTLHGKEHPVLKGTMYPQGEATIEDVEEGGPLKPMPARAAAAILP